MVKEIGNSVDLMINCVHDDRMINRVHFPEHFTSPPDLALFLVASFDTL